jgi:cyanate lyase
MSAIDFDLELSRVASPKGDRVKIGMCGKFLPFKYAAPAGNATGSNVEHHLEKA